MPRTLMKLSAAALAVGLALPAQAQESSEESAQDVTADTVVATVNGTEITLGNMLMVRAALPEQYAQLSPDVLWDGIVDQLIQQEVLSQSDQAEENRRVQVAVENERRSLMAAVAIERIADEAVTDEALQAAYDETYANADQGTEFNASHILVETEEEAQALVKQLNEGADFAELARENSTGPSGPNGGQLGWFGAGMMVDSFQEAVEQMEVGSVSEPVQTQFGWHVIKLNETRTAEAPALEEVRGELTQQIQQQAVSDYIDSQLAEAEVDRADLEGVDPTVLNQLDLLQD